MSRAVEALGLEPAWVLVDGNACPKWQRPSKAIVDGDAKCRSIAAASIIAKVTRDRIMADYAREYPGYGWERNRGYRDAGTLARAARAWTDAAPPTQLSTGACCDRWDEPAGARFRRNRDGESFESHPPAG